MLKSLVAAVGVLALAACGSASPPGPAAEANNGEAAPVPYMDARYHYRIDAPGPMSPAADGTAAFTGPSERLQVTVLTGSQAADAGRLARTDSTGLGQSLAGFQLQSGPTAVSLNGRHATKLVYRYSAGTSAVTGKRVDLVGVRYYIPKDATELAVVIYGIVSNQYDPQGADDLALTFQWL